MKNNQPTLDDMVFEHRNKLYGAFELRKSYANTLRKATIIGAAAMLFVTGSSFIYFKSQPKEVAKKIINCTFDLVELPDHEVKDIVLPLPPPVVEIPPPVRVIAYLPPAPVVDDLDFEEIVIPNQEELENAQISNRNVDGIDATTIVFDAPPSAPVITKEIIITEFKPDNTPFMRVEVMPEFVGGVSELYKWLSNNLRYPSAAVNASVEGRVFVKFIVEKDGKISKPEVLKGIGFGCDEEALKSLRKMPNWNPGMQNGKPVRVYFTLPIVFKLQ